MENNYIFLLTMTGFSYQYEWLRTGNRRALLIGSAAFGLNLLTRLPDRLGSIVGSAVPAAGPVVRRHTGPSSLGALQSLHRDRSAGLPVFWIARSPLSNLPLWAWISLCYLRHDHWPRNQDAQSFAASQLSLRDSLARRLLRGALHAGEVDLSLRSFDRAHDPSVRRRLEAIQSGRQSVRRHELSAAPGVHELLRSLYRVEWRLRLGRPLRFDRCRIGLVARRSSAAASSRHSWQSRCGS